MFRKTINITPKVKTGLHTSVIIPPSTQTSMLLTTFPKTSNVVKNTPQLQCIVFSTLLGASKCVQTDGLSCVNTTTYQHISEMQKLTALPDSLITTFYSR